MDGVRAEDSAYTKCAVCASTEKLLVCGKCKIAKYCSREHQKAHWKVHKQVCGKIFDRPEDRNFYALPDTTSFQSCRPEFDSGHFGTYQNNNSSAGSSVQENCGSSVAGDNVSSISPQSMGDLTPLLEALSEDQPPVYPDSLFNGLNSITYDNHMGVLNSEYGTKDMFYSGSESHNLSPTISSTTPQSQALTGSTVTSTSQGNVGYSQPSASNVAPAATPHQGVSPTQAAVNTQATQGKMKESANSDTKLADYVVKCLKNYGICVVDNFLGSEIATELLKEVCVLDALGTMNDGLITTTVNNHVKNQSIRSDKIAWVEKGQDGHQYIGKLINRLDNLIMQCQGRLDKYRINGRTRAMVACYPGGGTLYKRHIDNPSGDGRCITCIYYLNKGWKVEEHGGLLRIFPESFQSKVADIEPIFDRQIFFWSDKRNPHEVQPSFKTRYAITVWYFDAEERAKAKLRYQIDQMAKAGAL